MKKMLIAGAVASVLALAGCSSSGNKALKNETAETVSQKLQDGVTTKDQVKAAFGDPEAVNYTDNGHEIWRYVFTQTRQNGTNFIPYYGAFSHGTHGTTKTLMIIFDNDHVWHHVLSNSKVTTHNVFGNDGSPRQDGSW